MGNPEHIAILNQGADIWNKWREEHPDLIPDLQALDFADLDNERSQYDLSRANLRGSKLEYQNISTNRMNKSGFAQANLNGSTFTNSYLRLVNLRGAKMRDVDFNLSWFAGVLLDRADLSSSNLSTLVISSGLTHNGPWFPTDMTDAKLVKADLMYTIFDSAILDGVDFTGATLGWTKFVNVDLSKAKGLETVTHSGPSSIGIDTIFLSHGEIPDIFLRGCGVPDIFVDYARSLVVKPIEFFSSFISHSSKDRKFTDRLYSDLQSNGVRVWYFYEDAKWGETVWGEIDSSIKIYDKLIVVCSKHSLTSGPVLREMERALNREDQEGKNVLFPIRIDDYVLEEWEHPRKADVTNKVVGDFRGCRNKETYDVALRKLLKALTSSD